MATVTWPAVTATDNSGQAPTVFQSMQSGTTFQEGVYSVNVMATDSMGLSATCNFKVTVKGRQRHEKVDGLVVNPLHARKFVLC
ncbi:hypothetical protein DPMN_149380 [Dreissena polymorpha]|uniref:HYR domain-containing protein n=1 Tax=Dreissena polymorpha TaxID=45954 RepID=A0A9D4FB92_DREPO|nr:hypothetical protein DPMN_149380 [Dreissena polymorpha]